MNMRSIFKVVLAALLGIAPICQATEGIWTRKSDMPTARSGLCVSVVGSKIYAIGGGPSTGLRLRTVEQYDPATDMWTRKANTQIPRCFFGASTVNDKIYVIGGFDTSGGAHLASVEEYDPELDTWTMKASMPTSRDHFATAVVAGKIYAVGGLSSRVTLRALEEYDPASDTWTRRSDMPTPRMQASCSTVDGILYVIGGGIWKQPVQSTVEAYDPVSDTWTRKAPMPTARGFFSTCVLGGKIFAIGGCPDPYNSSELSSVEMYDPATDTWTIMDEMPTARKALATASVNGKIYAIGGQPRAGWDASLSTVEEYQLTPPPPDFNGDGHVDIKDLVRLIDSWYQNDPMVDIAPQPFSDGIVDALDLELFMNYWKQPIYDPTLITHWALDEVEGIIVADSVGDNIGYAAGDPAWQPAGGQIGGAIELDGIDDFISAPALINPSDGPFSILTWIKGGAVEQAIVSEADGSDWLSINPFTGGLMTELAQAGRGSVPLLSETSIVDSNWHRVGLTWDGLYRTLYVDDIVVAQDSQTGLYIQGTSLYIGCSDPMQSSSFFSGMIDDIRIYSRAVSP